MSQRFFVGALFWSTIFVGIAIFGYLSVTAEPYIPHERSAELSNCVMARDRGYDEGLQDGQAGMISEDGCANGCVSVIHEICKTKQNFIVERGGVVYSVECREKGYSEAL